MTDRRTAQLRGLTLIEVLVVIVILALLIGVLWPVLSAARRTPSLPWTDGRYLRVIQRGEVVFAEGSNGWGTGFDRNGKLDTGHVFTGAPQSTNWNGYDQNTPRAPAWRLRRLLEDQYITGEFCISTNETKANWQPGESMAPGKFSFALLKIEGEADSPRKQEHKVTNNAQAVVMSNRAIRNGSSYRSVHTDPGRDGVDWSGYVLWGDNHVTLEETAVLDTQYDRVANRNDNLFTDSNPSGRPNAEAAMAWKSAGDTNAELVE